MALKSSREGLRKELVDYLGNIIIDENLKQNIINSVDDVFINNEELTTSVNELDEKISNESIARQEAVTNIEELINNGVLKLDLLWTNASPTSEFRVQTISLDLSNYKMVIISHINYANENEYNQSVVVKGTSVSLSNSSFLNLARNVECNDNGLVFGEGYYYSSYNVRGKSPDYSACIPYKVYGVR